ncbi:hypothetical protein GGS23DRAFT_603957 [Durotheca rogersii]|uniref:uncharacterized protein n=1 Tax=Durotheca rogersii TaxID=419775 RepID=UPI0022201E1C|nr:uncharacterized protein GGS23DRAFT_603957 [Durotheca rogersii]KAI5865362.1 hypothetical protein GGS23DRAFT_603957 [Durotheca rogersii]
MAEGHNRQNGASNYRDLRHENGLVGPGKRVPKQKSQSPLNGNAKLPLDDAAVPSAPPTPPAPAPALAPASLLGTNGYSKQPPAEMHVEGRTADSLRRGSLGGFSESSSAESYHSHVGNAHLEESHRRIDVNATKNSNVHRDPGPFGVDFALTVLRSCPLQDTIAILIILMQIPPLALSGIYVLFTLLTFVTSNGLTFSDVFEWNLGTPSLATVVCVDGIVLLIWLFLWGPIQHVILDLAQMVIALGLGGGSSSRDGGSMKNTLICLSMILLSHILRHTRMKYSPMGYLLGSSRFMTPDIDDPLEPLESIRGYDRVQTGWFGWVKSILAIHILTQGLVKYIRDWYLRRERRDILAQNAADPEAGKSYTAENDGGFSTPDSDAVSLQNSTALTASTTKKKRKQIAQIRNKQPLWAAIASTKIVVMKEYELTHAAAESAGSNATDIHNLGNAPFNKQPEQIWISYVGCDEVCFSTSHFPAALGPTLSADGARIDPPKPFYVRVNNAVWQPTRMVPVQDFDAAVDDEGTRWSGDIYGLTPLSNYECEFVSSTTHEVLFWTIVRTTQAESADVDASLSQPAPQRSLRPDSPITTLKTSIAAADSKLAEEKARQKALRKEFHRKANGLKRENEKLSATVQSAGTGDDKLRQKIQQNTTQHKQAEQAVANLEAELRELESIPESLKSMWKAKQSSWAGERVKFDSAVGAFKDFKASVDRRIKALEEEKTGLQAKRNKISSRIAKVDGEHARIADANARGLDEAERRRQARESYENDITKIERELIAKVNEVDTAIYNKEQENLALKSQLDLFHTQQQAAYAYAASYDLPDAPGTFSSPGPPPRAQTNPVNAAPYDATAAWSNSLYKSSLWGPSPLAPGFVPHGAVTPHVHHSTTKARGRSSSMLSDVSGFTQSSVAEDEGSTTISAFSHARDGSGHLNVPPGFEYPTPTGPRSDVGGEAASEGSASLSDDSIGTGSIRDPTSPAPR